MLPMAAQHEYKLQAGRSLFDCESPDVTRSLQAFIDQSSMRPSARIAARTEGRFAINSM
jgi:hypothetical protein